MVYSTDRSKAMVPMLVLLFASTRRFVLCLTLCYILVFFSPYSIAIALFGEERANLSAFRTFVRFVLVWFCLFLLPLGVWEGLLFVIVALSGLFSYLFCLITFVLFVLENRLPKGTICMKCQILFPGENIVKLSRNVIC